MRRFMLCRHGDKQMRTSATYQPWTTVTRYHATAYQRHALPIPPDRRATYIVLRSCVVTFTNRQSRSALSGANGDALSRPAVAMNALGMRKGLHAPRVLNRCRHAYSIPNSIPRTFSYGRTGWLDLMACSRRSTPRGRHLWLRRVSTLPATTSRQTLVLLRRADVDSSGRAYSTVWPSRLAPGGTATPRRWCMAKTIGDAT